MSNQGGKRKGAGRKPAPYKTKTVAFRVRQQWAEHIKQIVKNEIDKLLKNADSK